MIDTSDLIQTATPDETILKELIDKYRIKADARYADKEYLLERDGVGFSPKGNVMAICAEKKAGKSWLCMAMASALLCGEYLGMKSRTSGCRCIYIDTEQDERDGQLIQRRVHYACGWSFEIDNDRFQIFHLREIGAQERLQVVIQLIELIRPEMVIVDGIRDLLTDFNDLTQSASVIQEFMRLSSVCNCAIWTVLHVNPNSEKMRGHLGTELGNKVADILLMTKTKNPNNEDDITYKMEEVAARSHKDIHSITFRIEDSIKPFSMPVLLTAEQVTEIEEEENEHLRSIMKKYVPSPGSISKTALQNEIKKGMSIGSNKAYKFINDAEKLGIIEKAINGKYVIIDKPIIKTEEIPF